MFISWKQALVFGLTLRRWIKALDVEGIFRLNGSAKRIKELQAIFDSPDRYGKGLDWNGYTVHDAANVLRRYLNQLPQPIVPLDFYERCREPLRCRHLRGDGDAEAQAQGVDDFDHDAAIAAYQRVIKELPSLNRQLLLYILDLLAVFAAKCELNRMNSTNLAAIFQPGMLSHPAHDMTPDEYLLSQEVLVFLIENQDSFLVGMEGTAADAKTVQEFQNSSQRSGKGPSPSTPKTPHAALGRSTSNASAGAESLRKFGGIRRNVSVSSKNSKASMTVPSPIASIPGSPHTGIGSGTGLQRSNTVPSKKSPGIPSRFSKPADSPLPVPAALSPASYLAPTAHPSSPGFRVSQKSSESPSLSMTPSMTPTLENSPFLPTVEENKLDHPSHERLLPNEQLSLQPPHESEHQTSPITPRGERDLSDLVAKPTTGNYEGNGLRQPNKLRKKRLTDSSTPSAHSSSQSLHDHPDSQSNQVFYTPMPTPGYNTPPQEDPLNSSTAPPFIADARQPSEPTSQVGDVIQETIIISRQDVPKPNAGSSLKPSNSPAISVHSRASVTDFSEASHPDEVAGALENEKKKRRWRFSSPAKKHAEIHAALPAWTQRGRSNTSVESSSKPRKSVTRDSQQPSAAASASSQVLTSSNETTPSKEKGVARDDELSKEQTEKKGPIGWLKAKVAQVKEERKERESEKDRAKSPLRSDLDRARRTQSLAAVSSQGYDGRESAHRTLSPSNVEKETAVHPPSVDP